MPGERGASASELEHRVHVSHAGVDGIGNKTKSKLETTFSASEL